MKNLISLNFTHVAISESMDNDKSTTILELLLKVY